MATELEAVLMDKMDQVRFGIEAEAFLNTPLGKFLQERAKLEVAEALEQLKCVDPCDHQQIVKLQNGIYRAESFSAWLAELITTGWEAEKEINLLEGNL